MNTCTGTTRDSINYSSHPTKQTRIEHIAISLGSSAKTVNGVKKFFESNSFPVHQYFGANAIKYPYSPEMVYDKKFVETYLSRKIGRENLLSAIAHIVELEITCRHSKYSEWYDHRQISDFISYRGHYKGWSMGYTNPCVRWVPTEHGNATCEVYTDRGALAAAVPVSWRILKTPQIDAALVPGDVCSSGSSTRRTRWMLDTDKMTLVRSGIAVKNADGTWEHADNMAGIAVARQEKARKIAEEQHSKKIEKLAARIERICKKIVLTYEDAKKLNYCDAGIQGFLRSIGLPIDTKQVSANLIPPTSDHRWQPVRHIAALRIAQKIAA